MQKANHCIDQLKNKWRNLRHKETKKVDAANIKRAVNKFKALCAKTGGGKAPEPLREISVDDDRVMETNTQVVLPDWSYLNTLKVGQASDVSAVPFLDFSSEISMEDVQVAVAVVQAGCLMLGRRHFCHQAQSPSDRRSQAQG